MAPPALAMATSVPGARYDEDHAAHIAWVSTATKLNAPDNLVIALAGARETGRRSGHRQTVFLGQRNWYSGGSAKPEMAVSSATVSHADSFDLDASTRKLVADLHTPRPAIFWWDMLASAAI